MNKKVVKKIKLMVTCAILFGFLWFLVLSPMITFHDNEKTLEEAARRYFDLNPNELPTGERVKTVSLNTLYHKSFLKNDLRIPLTKKTCSIENSWVKVKRVNGDYKYYTYLECGVLTSNIDHKGPTVKLRGDKEMTIEVGNAYEEPGIESVVDNGDGKMKIESVTVKGKVDTSKVGVYEVTYTAFDSLSNKTEEVRTIRVVKTLASTVKATLGEEATNFKGDPENNYIRLSNILFRIYGIDKNNNIIVTTDEDIANVNYTKIDSWLDYFYNHLNENFQKTIVPSEYCDMKVDMETFGTTECTSYTKKKKVSIPSVIEVNKAQDGLANFMRAQTMSWVANSQDKNTAFVTRYYFYGEDEGKVYLPYDPEHYYGVRPMMTIKGDTLLVSGEGTIEKPYTIGDVKKARGGEHVNERFTGEYVSIDSFIYRIVDTQKDGTTRVISLGTVGSPLDEVTCYASGADDVITYDPKDKSSVAYFINNRVSKYINTSLFELHEIEVPVYKDKIIYGEEIKKEKYKVKLSAPDMFEMFAAQSQYAVSSGSYWTINASQGTRRIGAIYNLGVPLNQEIPPYMPLRVRVVGYLKKDVVVSSGDGTFESPYVIK